jgi:DNA-binding response OmpR family regulator
MSKHALVVEDNQEIGKIYKLTLEMADYETEHVLDGKAALEWLETTVPQVVVLDMNLPQVSGHYLYKKLRADTRMDNTVVIISTANTLVANVLSKELAPQDHILMKPVSARQLKDLAEQIP